MRHEFFKLTIDDVGNVACKISMDAMDKGLKNVKGERKEVVQTAVEKLCAAMVAGLRERTKNHG